MPTSDYTPALTDVGALLASRTKDPNGNYLMTFTSATRPTDAQANELIGKATAQLENRIGADIDPQLWEPAKDVVALRVAMMIELSFFGDQITVGRSPYQELKDLLEGTRDQPGTLAELLRAVETIGAQSGDEDAYAPAGLPDFGFPAIGPELHAPGSERGCPPWPGMEW